MHKRFKNSVTNLESRSPRGGGEGGLATDIEGSWRILKHPNSTGIAHAITI